MSFQVITKENGKVVGTFDDPSYACKFGALLMQEGFDIEVRRVKIVAATSKDFVDRKVKEAIDAYIKSGMVDGKLIEPRSYSDQKSKLRIVDYDK
jgi:hypothetical protein